MSPENLLDLLGKDIDAGNRALEQMPLICSGTKMD